MKKTFCRAFLFQNMKTLFVVLFLLLLCHFPRTALCKNINEGNKWTIIVSQITIQESIGWGFRGERKKAPDGNMLVVAELTISNKSEDANERMINTENIFITRRSGQKGEYMAFAQASKLEEASFIPPEAIISDNGEMMITDKNGSSIAVGKKSKIPYLKVGNKPIQVLIAFTIKNQKDNNFTLHFGENKIKTSLKMNH